jgi:hypothetical protein
LSYPKYGGITVEAKGPAFECAPEIVDEQEKINQINKEREHRLYLDEAYALQKQHRLDMQHELAEVDKEITHLYMEIAYEDLFINIEPQYNFSYVHYIAAGSLWDAVQKYHPDLEMYEAVHNIEAMKQEPPSPKLLKILRSTEAEPENYPELMNELAKH